MDWQWDDLQVGDYVKFRKEFIDWHKFKFGSKIDKHYNIEFKIIEIVDEDSKDGTLHRISLESFILEAENGMSFHAFYIGSDGKFLNGYGCPVLFEIIKLGEEK